MTADVFWERALNNGLSPRGLPCPGGYLENGDGTAGSRQREQRTSGKFLCKYVFVHSSFSGASCYWRSGAKSPDLVLRVRVFFTSSV